MHGVIKQMTSEMKQRELEWRRASVLELASQGHSQREIANKLSVDLAAVNRDIQFLRQQARENLQHHIQERLPLEYQRCMSGLNQVLKTCWAIANNPHTEDRTKLQATAIINDSYKYVMDLTTNGIVVTDAIKYVNSKMNHLKTEQKKMLDIITSQSTSQDKETETETKEIDIETNGVF
jgi:Trp operon repressor